MRLNKYEKLHNQYLRENGAECTVLLKKDGNFPLSKPCEIALYGNGARRTIKGGTGSGEVNSRFFVTVEDGLKNAGCSIGTSDWLDAYDEIQKKAEKKFVKEVKKEAEARKQPAFLLGMGRIMQEPEYDLPMGKGETAIYVLARISGEGSDREAVPGDIFLTETEKRDILLCNANYKNFMLVINTGGVIDLSPVQEVKNILILSQLGVETGDILADILLGQKNPSGKLATTWTAYEEYPTIGEFGDENETRYTEGIYVGYRYFDSVGKRAMYPFGYGLSYTEFQISHRDCEICKETVTVSAVVKNTGAFAGKEAVQLYISYPQGKLNQPYQSLVGFVKTNLLNAGAKETVSISFDLAELASYDTKKEAYVLEKGDYILRLGNSSVDTEVAGVLTIEKNQIVAKAKNVLGRPDFKDYCPEPIALSKAEEKKIAKAKKICFSGKLTCYQPEYDKPFEISPVVEGLTEEQIVALNIGSFRGAEKLVEKKAKKASGNKSEEKSETLSIVGNAGVTVVGSAGQTSLCAWKKGIPSLIMADGPAGVRISKKYALDENGVTHALGSTLPDSMTMFMTKEERLGMGGEPYQPAKTDKMKYQYTTAIPIGTAIAQTFNPDFAEECGRIVGFEMQKFGVHLWLAPALNIHRNIRCGRNFEYYSEDPVVSGVFTAAITRGVQSFPGCGVTIKHYAANNQETNRVQSNSQVSERAMREIYLKGFQIAVKQSAPAAVMTSYNLLNGVHTSEHKGLLEDILRSEFGHKGLIMTDWNVGNFNPMPGLTYPLANPARSAAAGDNVYMPGTPGDYEEMMRALRAGEISIERLKANATYVCDMAQKLCKE